MLCLRHSAQNFEFHLQSAEYSKDFSENESLVLDIYGSSLLVLVLESPFMSARDSYVLNKVLYHELEIIKPTEYRYEYEFLSVINNSK